MKGILTIGIVGILIGQTFIKNDGYMLICSVIGIALTLMLYFYSKNWLGENVEEEQNKLKGGAK